MISTLAEKGKKRAACFKAEDMSRQYLDVFESLLANGKQCNNSITGMFSDRWTGSNFVIIFNNCEKQRVLKLNISLPEFVPSKDVKIIMHNNSISKHWVLPQGEEITIETPLASKGGEIHFAIHPTFKPSKHNISDDDRDLGAMLNKHVIATDDGEEDLLGT